MGIRSCDLRMCYFPVRWDPGKRNLTCGRGTYFTVGHAWQPGQRVMNTRAAAPRNQRRTGKWPPSPIRVGRVGKGQAPQSRWQEVVGLAPPHLSPFPVSERLATALTPRGFQEGDRMRGPQRKGSGVGCVLWVEPGLGPSSCDLTPHPAAGARSVVTVPADTHPLFSHH